jgi:CheY-like chemotaxis protein
LGRRPSAVQRFVDAGHIQAWKKLGGHRSIDAANAEQSFREPEGHIGSRPSVLSEATALQKVSAVVVNDDPMNRTLPITLVQTAMPRTHLETAANGIQGLIAIGKLAPQIVITDICMPNIDGFEAVRTLLQESGGRPRTLFAVSALSKQKLARRGTLPAGE